jgi:hypothetical protein
MGCADRLCRRIRYHPPDTEAGSQFGLAARGLVVLNEQGDDEGRDDDISKQPECDDATPNFERAFWFL